MHATTQAQSSRHQGEAQQSRKFPTTKVLEQSTSGNKCRGGGLQSLMPATHASDAGPGLPALTRMEGPTRSASGGRQAPAAHVGPAGAAGKS